MRGTAAAHRNAELRSTGAFAKNLHVSSGSATVRVFYALVPPPALQCALADLSREVALCAHGRPIPADNLHLTLAFIGTWPVARLPALRAVGDDVSSRAMRTLLVLDTRGEFLRAGVAWIGPSTPPPALSALGNLLADALASNDVTYDLRPFIPHLTLARRCRGPYPTGKAGPFKWNVDSLALMQSESGVAGSRYVNIASWPLCATAR